MIMFSTGSITASRYLGSWHLSFLRKLHYGIVKKGMWVGGMKLNKKFHSK